MAANPAPRASHHPLTMPLAMLAGLTAVSVAIALVSAGLSGNAINPLTDPQAWLADLDTGAAFDVLSNAAEVVAAVLAVATTVVAIVVELAANRYSHEITRLFLREPVNLIVLSLYVITTLQCLWVAAVMHDTGAGTGAHAGFAITLTLVVVSLLLLVPYIYFVFAFLSPISVIDRISRDAFRVIVRVRPGNIPRSQERVEGAVDQLQDVARSAITQGDRSIAIAAVDAMRDLLCRYVAVRDGLPSAWFTVSDTVAADPDFVALAPDTMAEVERQGVWLERKVMRRYLSLMRQSVGTATDVASVVGINTQQIATGIGMHRPHLLELCRRALNSFLRAAINAGDARTAYFLMNQYRVVGEELLQARRTDVVRIAEYLKEYGQLANGMGQPFLLETAAYDIMQLVELALEKQSPALDPLLDCFLTVDQEIRDGADVTRELGVRRAQLQLATLLLQRDDAARAERVIDDLRHEKLDRLEQLRDAMLTDDRSQFWELVDRGVNFRYLPPERRALLSSVFQRLQRPG